MTVIKRIHNKKCFSILSISCLAMIISRFFSDDNKAVKAINLIRKGVTTQRTAVTNIVRNKSYYNKGVLSKEGSYESKVEIPQTRRGLVRKNINLFEKVTEHNKSQISKKVSVGNMSQKSLVEIVKSEGLVPYSKENPIKKSRDTGVGHVSKEAVSVPKGNSLQIKNGLLKSKIDFFEKANTSSSGKATMKSLVNVSHNSSKVLTKEEVVEYKSIIKIVKEKDRKALGSIRRDSLVKAMKYKISKNEVTRNVGSHNKEVIDSIVEKRNHNGQQRSLVEIVKSEGLVPYSKEYPLKKSANKVVENTSKAVVGGYKAKNPEKGTLVKNKIEMFEKASMENSSEQNKNKSKSSSGASNVNVSKKSSGYVSGNLVQKPTKEEITKYKSIIKIVKEKDTKALGNVTKDSLVKAMKYEISKTREERLKLKEIGEAVKNQDKANKTHSKKTHAKSQPKIDYSSSGDLKEDIDSMIQKSNDNGKKINPKYKELSEKLGRLNSRLKGLEGDDR